MGARSTIGWCNFWRPLPLLAWVRFGHRHARHIWETHSVTDWMLVDSENVQPAVRHCGTLRPMLEQRLGFSHCLPSVVVPSKTPRTASTLFPKIAATTRLSSTSAPSASTPLDTPRLPVCLARQADPAKRQVPSLDAVRQALVDAHKTRPRKPSRCATGSTRVQQDAVGPPSGTCSTDFGAVAWSRSPQTRSLTPYSPTPPPTANHIPQVANAPCG